MMPKSYYAVIFSSQRNPTGPGQYDEAATRMIELAAQQPGFLGVESVRDQSGKGITISYWENLEAMEAWKKNGEHRLAQKMGRSGWYSSFTTKVCKVEREFGFTYEE